MKTPGPKKISVCIISLNEEACLKTCLESVKWADEIVIVDSGSTDNTKTIASEYTDKFFHNPWPGFGEQRQKAEKLASNDWILAIDCDEALSPELVQSLQNEELSKNTVYSFNRLTRFQGRWIKHSGWHPDWIARLYNRTHTSFNQSKVHEKVITTDCRKHKLSGLLYHYNEDSWNQYKSQLKKYASISANEKKLKNKKSNPLSRASRSIFAFLRHYVFKLGFLDGHPGWLIAWAQVRYTWDKYNLK